MASATDGADPGDNLAVWESLAPAWARHREHLFAFTLPASEWLLDAAGVGPGATVLELAAGTGETSLLAAERAGRVICTDLSPAMVEAARDGADARGASNVEAVVMDAQELTLADDSVDAVISRYGLMLLPAPDAAVREVRRVLRPGGRFAYAVWGPPEGNPWVTSIGAALRERGIAPAADPFGPGGLFSLATAERNRELLAGAGFASVRVEQLSFSLRFESFGELWSVHSELAGPLARAIAVLPDDEVGALRAALERSTAAYRDAAGGLELPTLTVAVSAG